VLESPAEPAYDGFMKYACLSLLFLSQTVWASEQLDCIKYLQSQSPYPNATEAAVSCKQGATVDCIKYLQKQPPFPNAIPAAKLCAPKHPISIQQ
jgi:hypothetical protein